MRRFILFALGLIALSLGVRFLSDVLVSDETKIRRRLEHMVEAFNDADPADVVAGFARDWTHAQRPIDRQSLLGGLFRESMEARDRETKRYRWRAELLDETLAVDVQGKTANARFELRFDYLARRQDGALEWETHWHIRVQADFVDGPDGWVVQRSSHEDLQGVMLER